MKRIVAAKSVIHICSFEAVGPIKPKTSYESFKHMVLRAGRFSCFEATANNRTADLYTKLCDDPEIDVIRESFPWMKVLKSKNK